MRRPSFFARLRRRSFMPALILGYVLLLQAILGPAAANAHAYAMAQQDALGLALSCAETAGHASGGANKMHDQEQPAADCCSCGMAGISGMMVLAQPELAPLYEIARTESLVRVFHTAAALPRAALFDSDLPARAPPATI